jgi:hypothetical protein
MRVSKQGIMKESIHNYPVALRIQKTAVYRTCDMRLFADHDNQGFPRLKHLSSIA